MKEAAVSIFSIRQKFWYTLTWYKMIWTVLGRSVVIENIFLLQVFCITFWEIYYSFIFVFFIVRFVLFCILFLKKISFHIAHRLVMWLFFINITFFQWNKLSLSSLFFKLKNYIEFHMHFINIKIRNNWNTEETKRAFIIVRQLSFIMMN